MRWNSSTSGMPDTRSAKRVSHSCEWSPDSTDTNTVSPKPSFSGSRSATRRWITPCASRRWMRFQHGVWERPDPVGDLGDGQGRVALEQVEDLAVDQVHGDSSRSGRDPAPSFSSACAFKLAREGKKRRKVSAGGRSFRL